MNKRHRGRGRRPNHNNNNNSNPNRSLDSNGPDIKVRGSAQTIYDKYITLARDARSGGSRVKAENYLQHAEHYLRIVQVQQEKAAVLAEQKQQQQQQHLERQKKQQEQKEQRLQQQQDTKSDDVNEEGGKPSGSRRKPYKNGNSDQESPKVSDAAKAETATEADKPKKTRSRRKKPADVEKVAEDADASE